MRALPLATKRILARPPLSLSLSLDSGLILRSGESNENPASQFLSDDNQIALASSDDALAEGDSVYIDGINGSDENPGTEAKPVKSFEKAKQLMLANKSDLLWVCGTVTLSNSVETWELPGKTIMRNYGFTGELVKLENGASLTLQNITLDGGLLNGYRGKASNADGSGGSIVKVSSNSTLIVKDGSNLQNNGYYGSSHWFPEAGGAVFADSGNVNIEGGTISNCQAVYGGGIYASQDATVNISNGLITRNAAVRGTASGVDKGYGGAGGAVMVCYGANLNFSGGTISNNTAYECGGGISVGAYMTFPEYSSSSMVMTGGVIDGNSAGSAGGGIFVQYGLSKDGSYGIDTYSTATISAGYITNNQVTNTGEGNSDFGGGAIYVNGVSSAYSDFHNGELHLTNAEISSNSAKLVGGGYAGCPASNTNSKLTNGVIFYGNETDSGSATEIYILASLAYGSHSGNPSYQISPSMLGGNAYRWLFDDGSEVPLSKLQGELISAVGEELCLNNNLSSEDESVKGAVSLATVHITGNRSETRGGGIGSNGSIFLGSNEYTTQVDVSKIWNDEGDKNGTRPEQIEIELYRDGVYVGFQTVTPDELGNWSASFENLPKNDADGFLYAYTVKERDVEGYYSDVTGDAESGFVITNTEGERPPSPPEDTVPPDEPSSDNPDAPGVSNQLLPATGDSVLYASALFAAFCLAVGVLLVSRQRMSARGCHSKVRKGWR